MSFEIKIAFIGWNLFQYNHVSALITNIPNAVFIFEDKHNSFQQNKDVLLKHVKKSRIKVYKSKEIYKLDKIYDVIVCQTVFTDIYKFKNAKIAMIQYGYAKEAHNYGAWRAFADICFTYGTYASKKISFFCPTKEIGFFRQEETNSLKYIANLRTKYQGQINPNKKTITYLPTWGEHSSLTQYLKQIESLSEHYNVFIKIHHNTDLLGIKPINKLWSGMNVLGAETDSLELIQLSDIVISDYSGAIFDALFYNKPVILLNSNKEQNFKNKVDHYSLEVTKRDSLGYIVNRPNELKETVVNLINSSLQIKITQELYDSLFSKVSSPHLVILETLTNLVQYSSPQLSQQQKYVRESISDLYHLKHKSLKYKVLNSLLLYSKFLKK